MHYLKKNPITFQPFNSLICSSFVTFFFECEHVRKQVANFRVTNKRLASAALLYLWFSSWSHRQPSLQRHDSARKFSKLLRTSRVCRHDALWLPRRPLAFALFRPLSADDAFRRCGHQSGRRGRQADRPHARVVPRPLMHGCTEELHMRVVHRGLCFRRAARRVPRRVRAGAQRLQQLAVCVSRRRRTAARV